jgi:hypothetical protein
MSIVVQGAIAVASSFLNQKNAARAKKLASDANEAKTRNQLPDQDYLVYRMAHGDNVTRYEYDKLRAPMEGMSPRDQYASGLYPVSRATLPPLTSAVIGADHPDFIGPPEARAAFAAAGNALPWIIGAAAALALVAFALKKGK